MNAADRSRRQVLSLCASLAAALGVSWLAFWLVRPSLALQLCAAAARQPVAPSVRARGVTPAR